MGEVGITTDHTGYRKNKRYYLLQVAKAEYVYGHTYQLTFNNKVIKNFDFKDYLSEVNENQVLFPLKSDIELFKSAIVENGVLTWNDKIDIAPEYLYAHGKGVSGKREIKNIFQKPNGNFYWTWTNFKKASYNKSRRGFKNNSVVEIGFENVEVALIEKKYCNYVIKDDKVVQFSCYINKIKPNFYDNNNIERIDYWRNVVSFNNQWKSNI